MNSLRANVRPTARRRPAASAWLLSGTFIVAAQAMVACGGPDPSGGTISTTSVPAPVSMPPAGLTVEPLQYRDDIVANRLQLQVTNGLPRQLSIASVQLLWTGMDSEPTTFDAVIGSGQRVDLPVALGTPACQIDGTTIGAPPPVDDSAVVFTLTDGTTEVAQVLDPDGTLSSLHETECERAMIGEQISLEFVNFAVQRLEGRDVTVAALRLRRQAAQGTVQVLSSGNTIPFSLIVGAGNESPLLALGAEAAVVETTVQFFEARCDAHAVAEAKQPFRFVMQVQLGDEPPRPYVVEPPPDLHVEMLAVAAAGCAVLGEDGSVADH